MIVNAFPPNLKQAPIWIVAFSALVLGTAYFFEHVLGVLPCALCEYQRLVWWLAMGLAGVVYYLRARPGLMAVGLATVGLTLLGGAGLAGFHVGVEQQWWAGPSACSGGGFDTTDIDALREAIMAAPVIRCDDVAWSLFGISMAGYNIVLSLAGAAGVAAVFAKRGS